MNSGLFHDADVPGSRPAARGLLLTALFGLLYIATAQRGASWQDSGVFQWRALTGDLLGVEGVARSHPLYMSVVHLLSRCVGPGPTPFALNVFSGVGMALAVGVAGWIIESVTRDAEAALFGAAWLGLAHMCWWMATIAEVYTWSLALLLVEVALAWRLFTRPRPLVAAALLLVNGVGLGVHNAALLSLPLAVGAVVWVVLWRRGLPGWVLPLAGAAWVLGAAPWLALVAGEAAATGDGARALSGALFGYVYLDKVLGLGPQGGWRTALANGGLFSLSLLSPVWLFALVPARRALRWRFSGLPAFGVWLGGLTAVHGVFFIRYFVPDQALFSLPTLALLALAAGVGLSACLPGWRRRLGSVGVRVLLAAGLLAGPVGYACAARVLHATHALSGWRRALPFRDDVRYWTLPWKQDERSAERFAAAALGQIRAGDVLYADSGAAGPLCVRRLLRPVAKTGMDGELVTFYDTWVGCETGWFGFLAQRPRTRLYVITPLPGYVPPFFLDGRYRFLATGVLHRAVSSVPVGTPSRSSSP